jgi:hypothetical protein
MLNELLSAAQDIMGFKHDEELPGVNYQQFDLLRETSPQSQRPWWKVWK